MHVSFHSQTQYCCCVLSMIKLRVIPMLIRIATKLTLTLNHMCTNIYDSQQRHCLFVPNTQECPSILILPQKG